MILRIYISLFLLSSSLAVMGQSSEKSLLWKITGAGIDQPSYLFGTIHLLCQDDLHIPDSLISLLSNTKQLALEYDMDEPGALTAVQKGGLMKDGKTLKSLLAPVDYLLLKTYFKDSLNMPIEMFGTFKPMLLSSYMMTRMIGCETASWELSLMENARAQNMDIVGIETMGDQLEVLDKIPLEKQAEMLVEGVKDGDSWRSSFREMVMLYKTQDIQALQQMVSSYSESVAEFETLLLVERNEKWIPVMKAKAQEMPTFFAVGAGHLGGEKGVVALLRQAGFTVEPIFVE